MTQYIPLDEVLKLLNEYPSSNTNKIIQALPEPINLSVIDEMKKKNNQTKCALTQRWNESLKEINQKLLSPNK